MSVRGAAAAAMVVAMTLPIEVRTDTATAQVELDIEQSPPHVQELARSVCGIVFREAIVREGTAYRLLLDRGKLPIHGTGFLVAPNVVATTLHVVGHTVGPLALVFDFVTRNGVTPERLDSDQVRDSLTMNADTWKVAPGYVFICFSEPLATRVPFELSSDFVEKGDKVFAIGHPAGVPMKYFPPATVTCSYDEYPVFTAENLGTTSGNSGSPVFLATQKAGRHDVVGAVNASYTKDRVPNHRNECDTGRLSQVIAVRATKLAAAVRANDPSACRMRPQTTRKGGIT